MLALDPSLKNLLRLYDAGWSLDLVARFGRYAGSSEAIEWSAQANENLPVLSTHDRFGHRVDQVTFHPAYHQLMAKAVEFGIHALPWQEERAGAHVARGALLYFDFQNEPGHCCPISMTYSVVPSLRKQANLAQVWEPLIQTNQYDSRFLPYFQKTGLTLGMGMTEKQGGSDVRANTTTARAVKHAGAGNAYSITGHKWFCSAPMSDAFLILAQAEKGVSCFLLPRFLPDGSKNHIFIQRLKDKLGNKANASSELEFLDATGFLVGEEGRGVPTIIEMVNHTRLDCIIGSTALMRQATLQAIHHCNQRSAFGKLLVDQPLMQNVLADLTLETEAALQLMMRVAAAYDTPTNEHERLFKRIGSAIAKYWICKRTPMHVAESLECLGGNGYVESGPMARLFRESPLLGIWEGSGNVICLDVLRAIAKEPDCIEALISELERSSSANHHLDRAMAELKDDIRKTTLTLKSNPFEAESRARQLVEKMALCLQAALMLRNSSDIAAHTFVQSRLGNEATHKAFGTLSLGQASSLEIIKIGHPHIKG